jgi:hypothetical protein
MSEVITDPPLLPSLPDHTITILVLIAMILIIGYYLLYVRKSKPQGDNI